MIWIFIALTAVIVVVIALVAVGRVTFTLAEQPRPSSYDLDEAVEFVADHLPVDATAELSYDDVREVLGLHLDYLEVKGVATEAVAAEHQPGGTEAGDVDAGGDRAGDLDERELEALEEIRRAEPMVFPDWPDAPARGPLVADDDEALPYILGRLAETEREIDDVRVVQVLEAERRYLEAIGAIGTPVPAPDDPIG